MNIRHSIRTAVCAIVVSLGICLSPAHAQNKFPRENVEQMQQFVNLMDSFFALIHSIDSIAGDSEKSAIYQMNQIKDIYEQQGKRADVIPVLNGVLKDAKSTAVRNAAYMLLSDVYKETGQPGKAIELLKKALAENMADPL